MAARSREPGRRLIRGLNRFALVVAGLAVAAALLVLFFGTLFFDDPRADYPSFAAAVLGPVVPALAVTAVCQVASRTVARHGSIHVAAFIAVLPVLAMAAEAAYLAG